MILSFTGTRDGMTRKQMDIVKSILEDLGPSVVIHGDCIGADAEFHRIVGDFNKPLRWKVVIKIYPSDVTSKRAYCDGGHIMPQMPPLERNVLIVKEGDRLIGCPKEMTSVLRSGTWSTIRKAKSLGKIVYIVLPNGEIR